MEVGPAAGVHPSAPLGRRSPRIELFLVSFLILFFELAAIRWFAATVVFLTFFTNIVLLACFLGMSVGLLTASRPVNLVRTVLPLAMVSFAAAVATNLLYWQWADAVTIGLGNQQASPQLVYFGTEYRPADPSRWVVPMWAVAGTFFTLIALTFIGLGQVMGRAFTAIPDRVAAYTIDVLGSLTGIAAFATMAWLQLPPTAWFVPIVLLALYFAGWRSPVQLAAGVSAFVFIAIGSHALLAHGQMWTPPKLPLSGDEVMAAGVPEFLTEPPSELRPAVVGTLIDERADLLAHRGGVEVEMLEDRVAVGPGLRREAHRLGELLVAETEVDGQPRQLVPPQARVELRGEGLVLAEERREERTDPGELTAETFGG